MRTLVISGTVTHIEHLQHDAPANEAALLTLVEDLAEVGESGHVEHRVYIDRGSAIMLAALNPGRFDVIVMSERFHQSIDMGTGRPRGGYVLWSIAVVLV